jgi:hypothetical protein
MRCERRTASVKLQRALTMCHTHAVLAPVYDVPYP